MARKSRNENKDNKKKPSKVLKAATEMAEDLRKAGLMDDDTYAKITGRRLKTPHHPRRVQSLHNRTHLKPHEEIYTGALPRQKPTHRRKTPKPIKDRSAFAAWTELKEEIKRGLASGEPTPLDMQALIARARRKFNKQERLALLILQGAEVFHGVDEFNAWLRAPCHELTGRKPLDVLISSKGLEELNELLGRLEHDIKVT